MLPVWWVRIGGFTGQGTVDADALIGFVVTEPIPRYVPVRPDKLLPFGITPVFGARLDVFCRQHHVQLGREIIARVKFKVVAVEIIVIHDSLLVQPPDAQPKISFVVPAR